MTAPTTPRLLTIREAAQRLGVSYSWLSKAVASRAVPCTVLGSRLIRFSEADLAAIVTAASHVPDNG